MVLNFRFSTYNCEGLVNGKEYSFRISAENLYGRSDPCEPSKSCLIQLDSRQNSTKRSKDQGRTDYNGPSIDSYDKFCKLYFHL